MNTVSQENTSAVTPAQLGLLHHTLGLSMHQRAESRNFFLSSGGHPDQANLLALTAAGLMSHQPAPSWTCGDDLFHVTEEGRQYAFANLPPIPAPVKRSNYQKFLHADFGCSFAEFMGIEVPRREHYSGKFRLTTSKAAGDWAPTLKAAKASYKQALAAYPAQHRPAKTANSQPA